VFQPGGSSDAALQVPGADLALSPERLQDLREGVSGVFERDV
jgi:hypothetical protein